MSNKYEVIVGNIGVVESTESKIQAYESFDAYVRVSTGAYGRASNEPVTMMCDGEICSEYTPVSQDFYAACDRAYEESKREIECAPTQRSYELIRF